MPTDEPAGVIGASELTPPSRTGNAAKCFTAGRLAAIGCRNAWRSVFLEGSGTDKLTRGACLSSWMLLRQPNTVRPSVVKAASLALCLQPPAKQTSEFGFLLELTLCWTFCVIGSWM